MRGSSTNKKAVGLFLMLFLFFGIMAFASATDVGSSIPPAKKVGFFNNWIDHIRLAFTFNKEKKIDLILHMAEKQLAAGEALGGNNSIAYNKTQANYDKLMARADKMLKEIKSSNNKSQNDSIKELNNIVRIQNMFERHRDHADEIYARAIKKFESKNVSQKRIERFEMFYNRSLDKSDEIENRIIQKRRNALLRYQNLTNDSNGRVRELMDRIDDNEGLTMARKVRMRNFERRTEYFKNKRIAHAELIRARFRDFNDDLLENHTDKSFLGINANRSMNREQFEMLKKRTHERIQRARNRINNFRNRTNVEHGLISDAMNTSKNLKEMAENNLMNMTD